MKKAKIYKNGSFLCETDRSGMSEQDLNVWLSKHIAKNTFGLPERPELALNEETGEMEPTGVILPAEYTIEIEDITAQVEQERINAESLAYLASTDWLIIRATENPLKAVPQEILDLRQAARDAIVR